MPFYLWGMAQKITLTTGWSKIHGGLIGVKVDNSGFQEGRANVELTLLLYNL